MIYFDNAATSGFKPKCVIDTVSECLTKFSVNPNRSGHTTAIYLSGRIFDVRQAVAKLTGLNGNVIFTQNCTAALNYIILGSVRTGGHVITSVMEHNSVLRPLMFLKEKGVIDITVLEPDKSGSINPEKVREALRPNTYLAVLTHASNVTGNANDAKEIGKVLRRANVLFALDAAQSAGYMPINMSDWGVDFLAMPAHKGLHGIMGCGVLCVSKGAKLSPVLFGGTGNRSHELIQPDDMPEGFESGTLNVPAILALGSAIEWWYDNRVALTSQQLSVHKIITQGLKGNKNVELFSAPINRSGIISFRVNNADCDYIANRLSVEYDIAVRSGLHCAPLIHNHLNTFETGLIRVSVSGTNTKEEADILINAINKITDANKIEII